MRIEIESPQLRRDVMVALASLADQAHQDQVWVGRNYPDDNYFDDLDLAIHSLYDDAPVLPNPPGAVGTVLVGGREVALLEHLHSLLQVLRQELGGKPDTAYLAHPRWPEIRDTAGRALQAVVLSGGWQGDLGVEM